MRMTIERDNGETWRIRGTHQQIMVAMAKWFLRVNQEKRCVSVRFTIHSDGPECDHE